MEGHPPGSVINSDPRTLAAVSGPTDTALKIAGLTVDLAGDVTVGVAPSADLAGDVTIGVPSSADLAEDVTIGVVSSADLAEVVTAGVCRPCWRCHRRCGVFGRPC